MHGEVEKEQQVTYEVEKVIRHTCKKGEYTYVVKWVGWETKDNTIGPEEHLLTCKPFLAYWQSKKNKKLLERAKKLQEAALREKEEKE